MNYEKGAKVLFYLWGIFILIVLIENILFSMGIGIPQGVSVIRSNFYYRIFFSIIVLTLIIFAYRGKEWAYYVFMIYLVYTFINQLFVFGSILAGASYTSEYTFGSSLFCGLFFWIFFVGASFYILYRVKHSTTKLFLIRKQRDQ